MNKAQAGNEQTCSIILKLAASAPTGHNALSQFRQSGNGPRLKTAN